jgi:hypothetical protein
MGSWMRSGMTRRTDIISLCFLPHEFVRPACLLLFTRGIGKNGIHLTANGITFLPTIVKVVQVQKMALEEAGTYIAYTAFLLLFITRRYISFVGIQTCNPTPSFAGSTSEFMSSYDAADTDNVCCECWS